PPETNEEKEPFGLIKVTKCNAFAIDTKHGFTVMYADIPAAEAAKGGEGVFKKMQDDMTKLRDGKAGKLSVEKIGRQGTIRGVGFQLDSPDGKKTALVRMYLVKNRLYVLMSGAFEGKPDLTEVGRFLDSFKITVDE